MKREYLKTIIGYFSEIENEKLLKKNIEKYECDYASDDNASYKEAYLVMKNDFKGKPTGKVFAVLDYENSFTIIDLYGNVETYYKDNFSERYVDECEIAYYFKDCYYVPKSYKLFIPLWVDICSTINRYGLDKEKFLNCFKNNDGDIDYNIVQDYSDCLKIDHVSDFVKYYYVYKLYFSKIDSVRDLIKYYKSNLNCY